MSTVYHRTRTRLKKTSTRMTSRQFAIMSKADIADVRQMKKAGELDSILDASGLILADKARAHIMRKIKLEKKDAT